MSTNPEVVEAAAAAAAAAMVPRTQWPSKLYFRAIYAYLCDNLATRLDKPELFVTYGMAIAHLLIQSVAKTRFDHWRERYLWPSWDDKSRFIRDAFTDTHRACDQLKNPGHESTDASDGRTCFDNCGHGCPPIGRSYFASGRGGPDLVWSR
jgi:hypothetical protein